MSDQPTESNRASRSNGSSSDSGGGVRGQPNSSEQQVAQKATRIRSPSVIFRPGQQFPSIGRGSFEPDSEFEVFFPPHLPEPSSSELDMRPSSRLDEILCQLFTTASSTIDICAHRLTVKKYTGMLIEAKSKRNVVVRVIADTHKERDRNKRKGGGISMQSHLTEMRKLRAAGIEMKAVKVNNSREEGLMHSKCLLIDGKHVLMGSMNLTYHGLFRNTEDYFYVREPKLSVFHKDRFDRLWSEGRTWQKWMEQ